MALLRCHGNSVCHIFTHTDIVNAQTWESSPHQKVQSSHLTQVQICEMFEPCDVLECLGHFNSIFPSLACILRRQHGIRGGKYFLKTPGNVIPKTLNFKMFLDASAFKNLCLWCEIQSCLLFIISLLLKTFLTALA